MGSPWLEAGPNEAVPNTSRACGVGAIGLLFNDEIIPEAIWLTSRTDDPKRVTYLMLNPLSPDFCSASWGSPEDLTTREDVSKPPPPRTLLPRTGVLAAKAFGPFLPVLSNSGTHRQGPGEKLRLSQEGKKTEDQNLQAEAQRQNSVGEKWGACPGHTGQVTEHTCRKGACKSGGVGAGATVVLVERKRGGALMRKSAGSTCRDGNGSLLVKCCKGENAQQVAAPDKWSRARLQGPVQLIGHAPPHCSFLWWDVI